MLALQRSSRFLQEEEKITLYADGALDDGDHVDHSNTDTREGKQYK